MKKLAIIIGLAALGLAMVSSAQTTGSITSQIPPVVGQTVVIAGQTYLLTYTNGTYTAITTGPGGAVSVSTPTSWQNAIDQIQVMVQENQPTNADFYTTNEIELRLGGVYEQNSGAGAALISATKWGLISSIPLGFEAGLLQGNQNGTSGTAGAYGALDYRWIIGDTAAIGGIGAGYDNYNSRPFALIKIGAEHRLSKNVGAWVDLNYALEAKGNATRGFGFAAGVSYAFSSFTSLH
jgi:hypothetical protein